LLDEVVGKFYRLDGRKLYVGLFDDKTFPYDFWMLKTAFTNFEKRESRFGL